MTFQEWFYSAPHREKYTNDHSAYLAAQEAWEEAHEACAKVCESKMPNPVKNWSDAQIVDALRDCAAAIRGQE